jgi:hypothetical protein
MLLLLPMGHTVSSQGPEDCWLEVLEIRILIELQSSGKGSKGKAHIEPWVGKLEECIRGIMIYFPSHDALWYHREPIPDGWKKCMFVTVSFEDSLQHCLVVNSVFNNLHHIFLKFLVLYHHLTRPDPTKTENSSEWYSFPNSKTIH